MSGFCSGRFVTFVVVVVVVLVYDPNMVGSWCLTHATKNVV